jgi:hypothetical protein
VCVKKIPAASKFWRLKKLKERKISCVIFMIAIDFNGANVMHIFDYAKEIDKNLVVI